jgi:hypothetical protein
MLPDFPDIKQIGRRRVREFIEQNIPQFAPILADIRRFRQHEGARGHITRVDASEGTLDYPETGFNFVLTRDEMKSLDMVGVMQKLRSLAEKFAEAQSKSMFETISAAAEAVGNVRKGVGELTPEAFLSLLQKMEMDFDERTGQPHWPTIVMHPDTLAANAEKFKEWDRDPAVRAELNRVIEQKREEWRARENSRTLAD